MNVLGIETSCDETGAAIVKDGRLLLSNVVASQAHLHARYGGVVPEVAARQHLEALVPVVEAALKEAGCRPQDVDAVGVTVGPGLPGSLLVGVNLAKALAYAWGRPLVAVNHLEAHVYANWLVEGFQPRFPALCLVVSGGHTDLAIMEGHGRFRALGRTRDDAAGEAFDKVARLLGLGFPGGPAIERRAQECPNPSLHLPRARLQGPFDFSFSGIKTHVARLLEGAYGPPPPTEEVAAAFQEAVVDTLVERVVKAVRAYAVGQVLLSGGVAANSRLREELTRRSPVPVHAPPPFLCTDNGAMVAACAYFRLTELGETASLDVDVEPSLRLG
jgi:N6-L-threonylcarbamoyladenine synthase